MIFLLGRCVYEESVRTSRIKQVERGLQNAILGEKINFNEDEKIC
jgi:hypothetical protein